MERVLSDEEKFRKAEEIYNRRRNLNVTVPTKNLNRNNGKKEYKRFRKMLIQIGICIFIYFVVYFMQYSNYFFSSEVSKKIEMLLTYNIDFKESFNHFNEFMKNNKFFSGIFAIDREEIENEILQNNIAGENVILENTVVNNEILENKITTESGGENKVEKNLTTKEESKVESDNSNKEDDDKVASKNKEETNSKVALGTGGGQSGNTDSDEKQMKEDAKVIKDNFQITLPLRGTITSRYGEREIEPKFHTGIDIARNTGSEIISATNGTVILAEEQASYGKVLKIQNNNLILLYAHCNELLVDVGDKIKIRQKIAKVGSTGNSTGPHLHFEIIYCGRYVNPEYVLEFKE